MDMTARIVGTGKCFELRYADPAESGPKRQQLEETALTVSRKHHTPVEVLFNPASPHNIVADNYVRRDAAGEETRNSREPFSLRSALVRFVPAKRLAAGIDDTLNHAAAENEFASRAVTELGVGPWPLDDQPFPFTAIGRQWLGGDVTPINPFAMAYTLAESAKALPQAS